MSEQAQERAAVIRDPSLLLDNLSRYCEWCNEADSPAEARREAAELLSDYGLLDNPESPIDFGKLSNVLRGEARHQVHPDTFSATLGDTAVLRLMARYNQRPIDFSSGEWPYSLDELAVIHPDLPEIANAASLSVQGLSYRSEVAGKAMQILHTTEGGRYILAQLQSDQTTPAEMANNLEHARAVLPIPDTRLAVVPSGTFLLTEWVTGKMPETLEELQVCREASAAFRAVHVSAGAHFDFQPENWRLPPSSPAPIYIDCDLIGDVVERGFVGQLSEQHEATFRANLERTLPL